MSFPLDQEAITPLTDGVDYEEVSNVNNLVTKLANIVSYLGAAGNAQSKLVALNRLFKYMLKSLPTVTWIDVDTIKIAPCAMLMHSGNNYVIKENTSALQIKLSVDLDTGAEAASTMYDVYLIGDGSSSLYTAKFVLRGNTPSGATYYKKIFSIRNNSSSDIIEFTHSGDWIYFHDCYYNNAELRILNNGTQTSFTDVDFSGFAPIGCTEVKVICYFAANTTMHWRPNGSSAATGVQIEGNNATLGDVTLLLSPSQIGEYMINTNSVCIFIYGFKMNL